MSDQVSAPSTRPYLIRALHEWCSDHGLTPYVAVMVDRSVQVPQEFVKDGEIVLNISTEATSHLNIDNEYLSFKARFGGVPREIVVPISKVMAIYARENGQGMAFPMHVVEAEAEAEEPLSGEPDEEPQPPDAPQPTRTHLRRIK